MKSRTALITIEKIETLATRKQGYQPNKMRIYRAGRRTAATSMDPREFPPYFAVCVSVHPIPQFQVLSLQPAGHIQDEVYMLENENPQIYRDVYFENRQRNPEDYLVGTVDIQKPNSHIIIRVRFEIRQMFLVNYSLQLPIVLLDDITLMPRPEVLIVPVNLEPSEDMGNNPYAIMNHLLNPNRIREYEMDPHRRRPFRPSWPWQPMINDDTEPPARGGAGSSTSRGQPRQLTPPPPPRPAPATTSAPAPTIIPPRTLQSFTINALINQAVSDGTNCPILMVPIEKNTAAVMNCQHIFNRQAIHRWLADGNTTCPVCREVCHICN